MTEGLLLVRLIQFSAVVVLLGGASFRLYAGKDLGSTFDRWLWRVLACAAVVSLFSSVAWLLVQSAIMGDSWASAVSGETLSAVLLQTEFGRLWIARLAIAVVLLTVVLLCGRNNVAAGPVLTVVLSFLLVASLAGTGHAVMASGLTRAVSILFQAVHLVAAAVWLGGLLPLGYVLRKAQRAPESAWLAVAQAVLPRYSYAGLLAVISLLLTGLLISWSLIGGIYALFQTTYGQLLLAKVVLFLLMVGVALVNRFNLTPRVIGTQSKALRTYPPLFTLWRNVAVEQALGLAILGIVSVLGMLPPGGEDPGQESAKIARPSTAKGAQGYVLGDVSRRPAAPDHNERWNGGALAPEGVQS